MSYLIAITSCSGLPARGTMACLVVTPDTECQPSVDSRIPQIVPQPGYLGCQNNPAADLALEQDSSIWSRTYQMPYREPYLPSCAANSLLTSALSCSRRGGDRRHRLTSRIDNPVGLPPISGLPERPHQRDRQHRQIPDRTLISDHEQRP
jgi:hypothetical protein